MRPVEADNRRLARQRRQRGSGVGMLFTRRVRTLDASMCRHCGLAMFREMQKSTLIMGWWGLISFFANILYIFTNLDARADLRRLPSPSPTPRTRFAPLPYPMSPGRPMHQRFSLTGGNEA
jgi:hypothetical protein